MEGEKGPAGHIFVKNLYSQYRKISNILNPIIENVGVHKVHFLMMASQYLPDLNSERRPPAYLCHSESSLSVFYIWTCKMEALK